MRSISSPIRWMTARSVPKILMPTGVFAWSPPAQAAKPEQTDKFFLTGRVPVARDGDDGHWLDSTVNVASSGGVR